MDKVFLDILNMSLTASFVIVAVCAARVLLRRAPKVYSYALWAVVLFNLIIPFKFTAPASLNPIKPETIPQNIVYQAAPRIDSGVTLIDNSVSNILPAPDTVHVNSVNPLQIWLAVGALLWAAGIAAMLLYAVITYIRLKRKLRFATKIDGDINESGNIYETDAIRSPFVLGLIRPRIYLPVGLPEIDLAYILPHERTHIKRRDYLIKPLDYLTLALHWFNPLVWLAYFLLNKDMEMSCDERVLKELSNNNTNIKEVYSNTLLRLATGRRQIGLSPLAFGEGSAKGRIKNVLHFRKPSRWVVAIAAALVVLFSAGFAVSKAGAAPVELKNLSADDIVSFTVMASPPDETKTISNRLYISSLADYLRSVVIYNRDDSYHEHYGQWVEFTLAMKSGETLTVAAYNPFIVINGVGYRTKYEPCEALNSFANNLLSTQYADAPVADLSALRTPYVGNNSAVGKILDALPPLDAAHTQRFYSISDDYGTGRAPYTLTVYYEQLSNVSTINIDEVRNFSNAPKNAALLFALIGNLEEVNFAFRDTPSGNELDQAAYTSRTAYSKDDISQYLLDNFAFTFENFQSDWNGTVEKLFAPPAAFSFSVKTEPGSYTPAMSSYPGIYLNVTGQAETGASVRYDCLSGQFGTLTDGKITFLGNFTMNGLGSSPAVFWTPDAATKDGEIVTVRLSNGAGAELTAVSLTVRISDDHMYSLAQEPPVQITSGARAWSGPTRKITLADIRGIAQKIGPDLTMGDLRDFFGTDIGSGLYIMAYEVESGEYRLTVGSMSTDMTAPVMYAYLGKSGGAQNIEESIDIRYYDVDKYLADGTRELARPLPLPDPMATALPQPAANLDDAIDIAIVAHNSGKYGGSGDYAAANHVTLKTVENGNLVTFYIMAFYAVYANDGGVRQTAGSHIPVAITLEKPSFGLVEYWEAQDGSYYLPSIHEKFPSDIWDKVDTQLYVKEQQDNCLQKAIAYYASLPPATAESTTPPALMNSDGIYTGYISNFNAPDGTFNLDPFEWLTTLTYIML